MISVRPLCFERDRRAPRLFCYLYFKDFPVPPVLHITERIQDQQRLDPEIGEEVPGLETDFPAGLQAADAFHQAVHILFSKTDLPEEDSFYEKTCQQRKKVEKQLEKRHVFINQPDTVPCGGPHLETVVLGTACTAAYMVDDGIRAVPVLISMDPCAVSDVNILQICKM